MSNRIPENTNVEAKITRWLYMKDVMTFLIVFVGSYILQAIRIVPESATLYMNILQLIVILTLIIRPFATNPKRRSLRVFWITVRKDRNVYAEIPYEMIEKDKEVTNYGNVQNATRNYKDFL